MKTIIITLLFIIVLIGQSNAQYNLKGNLDIGKENVGFKKLEFTHQARKKPTKISVNIWYPSKKSKAKKHTFSDYLNPSNEITSADLINDLSTMIAGDKGLFGNDTLENILNAKMLSTQNAKEQKGKYPLLLWSSRYETTEYQCLISEYLASHGYIVAFAEDLPNSPFPWQLKTVSEKKSTLNDHVADLNATLSFFKQRKNIDTKKIGLLAWSYAGESAILTQINNKDIKLVVGLSGIGFNYGMYLGQNLKEIAITDKMDVPYLILSERIGTNGKERTKPAQLDEMHKDSRFITFNKLAHGSFNFVEGMLPGILKTDKTQSWSKGNKVAQLGYEAISQTTLIFISTVFQNTVSDTFDKRIERLLSNYPQGFISIYSPQNQ